MAKSRGWKKSFLQKQKRALENKLTGCLEQRKRALGGIVAIERDELKDSIDLANAVLEQEIPLRQANDCAEQIPKIERALQAIKDNEYGTCIGCSELISRKRLNAVPWATKCTACQQAEELR